MLGIDQRELARLAGLSLPTIQRMEASDSLIRGTVDSLMKIVKALDSAGVELIGENATSDGGGRGVRLKRAFLGASNTVVTKVATKKKPARPRPGAPKAPKR